MNRRSVKTRSFILFLLTFFVLECGWNVARGSRLERWVVDDATVSTAVTLINAFTPSIAATAHGKSIFAVGGGINVRNGCEGTEVLFLLIAALVAYPFIWRHRLIGLAAGTAFIFLLNQARLLGLFYSLRSNRELFEQLHGLIAPLALIVCTVIFFGGLLRMDQKARATTDV